MTASLQELFDTVFTQLSDDGLLLLSDANLLSVSALVAGEKVRGSWWSHKRGRAIFAVAGMLEDHEDVMIVKLISGKVTFVHRDLWNAIYSIGVAREDWQMNKLSADARRLLKTVDKAGSIQTNELDFELGHKRAVPANELESRLLVRSAQVHTESGAHAKVVETWNTWAKRSRFRARANDPVKAKRLLEQRLTELNNQHNGRGKLPWPSVWS